MNFSVSFSLNVCHKYQFQQTYSFCSLIDGPAYNAERSKPHLIFLCGVGIFGSTQTQIRTQKFSLCLVWYQSTYIFELNSNFRHQEKRCERCAHNVFLFRLIYSDLFIIVVSIFFRTCRECEILAERTRVWTRFLFFRIWAQKSTNPNVVLIVTNWFYFEIFSVYWRFAIVHRLIKIFYFLFDWCLYYIERADVSDMKLSHSVYISFLVLLYHLDVWMHSRLSH